jgi:peptidyl-prolyl cis-trans isomerase B (cyclophilin B)
MRQPLFLLATFAVFAPLFLAGCGGSSSSSSGTSGEATAAVTGTPLSHEPQPDPVPRVLFSTTAGDIIVQLNPEKAPFTVENFLHYVDAGFYADTIFHAVRRDDVVIGGGYTRDLKDKAANRPPVRNEAHNGLKNSRGTIAMVREPQVIDSSTSQFFFNLGNNSDYLDPQPLKEGQRPDEAPEKYGYCVFGEVVEGMDVLDKISKQEVADQGGALEFLPKQLIVINEVRRVK